MATTTTTTKKQQHHRPWFKKGLFQVSYVMPSTPPQKKKKTRPFSSLLFHHQPSQTKTGNEKNSPHTSGSSPRMYKDTPHRQLGRHGDQPIVEIWRDVHSGVKSTKKILPKNGVLIEILGDSVEWLFSHK